MLPTILARKPRRSGASNCGRPIRAYWQSPAGTHRRGAWLPRRAFHRHRHDFRTDPLGRKFEVAPDDVLSAIKPRRTSKLERAPRGFSEPTASIVWSTLLRHGMRGNEFVLWNVFPWHSFAPRLSMLSNRMPTHAELGAGAPVLKALLSLFPDARVVAVGRLAASQLPSAACVRHPASGGSVLFRRQIASLLVA